MKKNAVALLAAMMAKLDPRAIGNMQGQITFLWATPINQQIQIEMNGAGTTFELNGGTGVPGYQDVADIIKGCYLGQRQIIVVYGTIANPDGSFPILQVAGLA